MWLVSEMQKIKRKLHNSEIVKRIHIFMIILSNYSGLSFGHKHNDNNFISIPGRFQCKRQTLRNFILNQVASDPGKADYAGEPLGPLRNR